MKQVTELKNKHTNLKEENITRKLRGSKILQTKQNINLLWAMILLDPFFGHKVINVFIPLTVCYLFPTFKKVPCIVVQMPSLFLDNLSVITIITARWTILLGFGLFCLFAQFFAVFAAISLAEKEETKLFTSNLNQLSHLLILIRILIFNNTHRGKFWFKAIISFNEKMFEWYIYF